MIKLYDIVDKSDYVPDQTESLYIKEDANTLNFMTYFNSFSITKWRKYSTIQTVRLVINHIANLKLTIYVKRQKDGEMVVVRDAMVGEDTFTTEFSMTELPEGILGFIVEGAALDRKTIKGAYYGEFASYTPRVLGIGICTYNREEFLMRNLGILQPLIETNPNIRIIVVNNGNPLQENNSKATILPNKNFGGSGGFTRALIEWEEKLLDDDYVLLMDDDIVIDLSVLERTYTLLCGLKDEYKENFLGGAMIRLEEPLVQHENTAYWGKIRLYSQGQNRRLDNLNDLMENELPIITKNQYAAWWYCCIPVRRIREIGYPLPIFIKGDDIEYSLRNGKEILHMNGIGVWHQGFQGKRNPVIDYYSDRNMLMMNNFAKDCGFVSFVLAVVGRTFKRLYTGDIINYSMLYLALKDYNRGLDYITRMGSDQKMQEIIDWSKKTPGKYNSIYLLIKEALLSIVSYHRVKKDYSEFRKNRLSNNKFWKAFLGIKK